MVGEPRNDAGELMPRLDRAVAGDAASRLEPARPGELWWLVTAKGSARVEAESGAVRVLRAGSVLQTGATSAWVALRPAPDWEFVLLAASGPFARDHAKALARAHGVLPRRAASGGLVAEARRLAADWAAGLADMRAGARLHAWLVRWQEELATPMRALAPALLTARGAARLGPEVSSVDQLAVVLKCSRSWLQHTLKKRWGRTPARALREARLEWAAERLRAGEPIASVAEQAGYASVPAFGAAFRSVHGLPPGRWLATRRRRGSMGAERRKSAVTRPAGRPATDPHRLHSGPGEGPYFGAFNAGETEEPINGIFDLALNATVAVWCLVVTLEGEAIFETATRRWRVGPGTVVAHPQPMRGRWRGVPGKPRWRRMWLQLEGERSAAVFAVVTRALGTVHRVAVAGEFARALADLIKANRGLPVFMPGDLSARVAALLAAWQAEARALPAGRGFLTPAEAAGVDIGSRTVTGLAEANGLPRAELTRRLQRQWGKRHPAQAFRDRAMEQAADLLRRTTWKVARIAREVGYAENASFTRAFVRYHGVAPLAYRRLCL